MTNGEKISGVISLVVVMPIWYWLMYQILERVQASELMWFLYWIYVPAGLLSSLITKLAGKESK